LKCRFDDLGDQPAVGEVLDSLVGNNTAGQPRSLMTAADEVAAAAAKSSSAPSVTSCFVVGGAWQRNQRYQIRFSVTTPASSGSRTPAPQIWVTPLVSSSLEAGYNWDNFTVLSGSSKYGALCEPPAHRRQAMSASFDACSALEQLLAAGGGAGALSMPASRTSAACLQQLQTLEAQASAAAYAGPINAGAFPFTAPPLTNVSRLAGAATGSCAEGSIFSARAGGECVDCTWGVVKRTSDGVLCAACNVLVYACWQMCALPRRRPS
jgi:hypothetical protein